MMPLPGVAALERAISAYPADAQGRLRVLGATAGACGVIAAADATFIAAQLGQPMDEAMRALLPVAQCYALPAISRYRVGALVQGESGALYCGGNIEFAGEALTACLHAEQVATINAWMHGERGLQAMAVTAAPCGHCRQFLSELDVAATLRILVLDRPAVLLAELLPHAFGPRDLGQSGGLMGLEDHQLALEDPVEDPLALAALVAANRSYAPYSLGYAGAAVRTADGQTYIGSYAENAAFNPSIAPMAAALAHLALDGQTYDRVQRAVLVQARPTLCSQVSVSRAVLAAVSAVQPVVVHAHVRPGS